MHPNKNSFNLGRHSIENEFLVIVIEKINA